MVGGDREVGMGFESEPPRELDSTEHQMLGQLHWRGHGELVVSSEHGAAKLGQPVVGHRFRAYHVFDAKAEGVDQVHAHPAAGPLVWARDHHRSQPARTVRGSRVDRPVRVRREGQPVVPAWADWAAVARRPRSLDLGLVRQVVLKWPAVVWRAA